MPVAGDVAQFPRGSAHAFHNWGDAAPASPGYV
jgi:hypothetical protein